MRRAVLLCVALVTGSCMCQKHENVDDARASPGNLSRTRTDRGVGRPAQTVTPGPTARADSSDAGLRTDGGVSRKETPSEQQDTPESEEPSTKELLSNIAPELTADTVLGFMRDLLQAARSRDIGAFAKKVEFPLRVRRHPGGPLTEQEFTKDFSLIVDQRVIKDLAETRSAKDIIVSNYSVGTRLGVVWVRCVHEPCQLRVFSINN
jgi:hypothetical protein